jgi:serine/threonine-protein kinase PknG
MNCLRPGCTGQIDDGFCNLCGLAPSPGASLRSSTGPSVPASSSYSARSGSGLRTRRTRGSTTATVSRGNLGAAIEPVQVGIFAPAEGVGLGPVGVQPAP